jgi:signal transduction histidine kinase
MIDEIFENLRHTNRLPEVEVKILDDKVPQVIADRMRMKIILTNLLSNAVKYQHSARDHRPAITIHSELNRQNILIHVKDNGYGIREEYVGRIFDMFFRGSLDSDGSGLGLYIAKEAAQKMNGRITVNSVYGKGSIFTVYLPLN